MTTEHIIASLRAYCADHPTERKADIAAKLSVTPSGLSNLLSGVNRQTSQQTLDIICLCRGTSPAATILNLQESPPETTTVPRQQFSRKGKELSSHLEHAQYASVGGHATREGDPASLDPEGDLFAPAADLPSTDQPSYQNLMSALQNLYRALGGVVNPVQKAKVQTGPTSAPRVSDSRSNVPGPRGDGFGKRVRP